jgi:hypothetical protein
MAVRIAAPTRYPVVLALFALGCVPPDTQDKFESDRDEANYQAYQAYDQRNAVATESKFIADQMFTAAAEQTFKERACPRDDSQAEMSEQCAALLYKAFLTRLGDKYSFADFRAVFHHCDGYPDECIPEHAFEVLVRTSQKARAEELWAHRQAEVQGEYDRKVAATKADVAQALAEGAQTFAESMTSHVKSRTRCHTNADGDSVNTDCVERVPNQ